MATKNTRTKKTEKAKISLWVDSEVLERIDDLAKMGGITRTKLMNNMLDETSKTLRACGKVGILQVSLLIRDMGENLSDWAVRLRGKKIDI